MTAERHPDTVAAATQDGGMPLRIGSLFAGYGGLDLGLHAALGDTEPAWFSEIDDAPSRVLAHHWPDVPNLGDVTAVDWADVEPVDVLTGGFPCQDVSIAGLRRGLKPGTRSGLWAHFALAIDTLRPPLVVIENVRGLLSAEAHSDLEPDPWDLGEPDRLGRPALRALGAVLGDLAELGYDASWHGVRAADAGAPHSRFRVFVTARPADPDTPRSGCGPSGRDHGLRAPRLVEATRPAADPDDLGGHRSGRTRDGWPEPADRDRAAAADTERCTRLGRADEQIGRPSGRAAARQHRSTAADASGSGRERRRPDGQRGARDATPRGGAAAPPETDWGPYRPAVARWEHVTGRLAPAPTEQSTRGAHRLNPAFVEWMMGLPVGHVTDPAIGLTRNEQLKALGNGVVPQQAALALRLLLTGEAR